MGNINDKVKSLSQSPKGQMAAFLCVLAFFVLSLIVPSAITGALFFLVLFAFTLLLPAKGLAFLILYFPARSFYIEVNPFLKIAGEVVVFAVLLHVLWASRKQLKSLFHFYAFEWGFFAFCAIGSAGALLNGVSIMAIITQLRAFLLLYLVFYVMKRLAIKKEDFNWYIFLTVAMGVLLAALGIIEKISDKTVLFPAAWEYFSISPTNGGRVYGLAKNPNVLASFLLIAVFAAIYLKGQLSGWKHKVAWAAILLIGTAAVLTYSRGTLLALAVGFVVYVIWKRNWKHAAQIVVIGASSLVLALYVVEPMTTYLDITSEGAPLPTEQGAADSDDGNNSNAQTDRFKETFEADTIGLSASGGRLWILKKGFEVFGDYPIIGSGFATFGDSASLAYGSPIYGDYELRDGIYTDNQYIQVIAQTGVLGVIAFAVFVLSIFWHLLKRRNTPEGVFTMLLFIGVMASCVVYNTWEDKSVTLYLYGLLGIVLSLRSTQSKTVEADSRKYEEKPYGNVSQF